MLIISLMTRAPGYLQDWAGLQKDQSMIRDLKLSASLHNFQEREGVRD